MPLTIERTIELIKEHDLNVAAEKRGLLKYPLGGLNLYVTQTKAVLIKLGITSREWDSFYYDAERERISTKKLSLYLTKQ